MATSITLLAPGSAIDSWGLAETMLQPCLDRTPLGNLLEMSDVKEGIETENYQLWFVFIEADLLGAVVTQVLTYPKARVLDVMLCAGTRNDEWQDSLNAKMRQFAQVCGCDLIRGYGRLGWARRLRHEGIEPSLYFDVPAEG